MTSTVVAQASWYNVAAVSHGGGLFTVVARRQDGVEPSLRSFLVRRVPSGQ
jgi:hypothetical protein